MNILAIDTAAQVFSLGLSVERAAGLPPERYLFAADAPSRHSELITDMIDVLFRKAGIEREALEAVVCMKGPGSFTGIRIGWACAKGLALALNIPMAAYPTLDCMALPLSFWPGMVLPAIDAKKHAFYCSLYRDGRALTPAMDAAPGEIARAIDEAIDEASRQNAGGTACPVLLTGPAAAMLLDALSPLTGPGRLTLDTSSSENGFAAPLLDIARVDIEKKSFLMNNSSILYSGPDYIRKSDAELNLENKGTYA